MTTLNIVMIQHNPTVGDLDGNFQKMEEQIKKQYTADKCNIFVMPELCITGYYPGDMLENEKFIQAVDGIISKFKQLSNTFAFQRSYFVIGAPTINMLSGKKLHNSLLLIHKGNIVCEYHKQLLPTYDVFDDFRHFEPGFNKSAYYNIEGTVVSFLICEDIWNNNGADYPLNPFQYMARNTDILITINASPSNIHKEEKRLNLFTDVCRKYRTAMVYVNQTGGSDQLVYDGASFIIDRNGCLVDALPAFVATSSKIEYDPKTRQFEDKRVEIPQYAEDSAFYLDQLIMGLRDYLDKTGFKKVVIGSSGGIDSAVTMAIAAMAIGAENVVGITMPSEYSSEGSVSDSKVLCENFGIKLIETPIRPMVDAFKATMAESIETPSGVALENLQARIRGTLLMTYSNMYGHMVLTTGNKSEISVGYCTLYGDTNGGLGLLGDLYKTEVFALARYINKLHGTEMIPYAIIDKPPSAELAPGQVDSQSLPEYPVLDAVLKMFIEGEHNMTDKEKQEYHDVRNQYSNELIARIEKMVHRNEYKRKQSPPHIRVRNKAFGSGRQIPVAANHSYHTIL